MLETVKIALRVSNDAYSDEITDLIEACKKDLKTSGVALSSNSESDVLIKRAIVTYCKAYFGYDNPDYERLVQAYDLLKVHLALSSDYNTEVVTNVA